jgi:hypothetical protein
MRKLLLQTTIEADADDWNVERFSRLRAFLSELDGPDGKRAFDVTARNRSLRGEPDPVLSRLDVAGFDQLWLFAVDVGNGLTREDASGIESFWRAGGGLMVTRDHMDLGCSICTLGVIGAAHHFHTHNCERDQARHCDDDRFTGGISWPNYHSGANGDYQHVEAVGPVHPVMRDPLSPTGVVRYLPSHPHEGVVSAVPDEPLNRVIARGRSAATGRDFNIAVAFERSQERGRAIAQSTFHHFADYNWDPSLGSPSFVSEPAGTGMRRFPEALRSTRQYVRNLAFWLAGAEHDQASGVPDN